MNDVQVRSSLSDKIKKYFVKGYATFKNIDTYNTRLSKKAMDKVAKQIMTKDIKIGIQHQKTLSNSIMSKLLELKKSLKSEGKDVSLINQAISYQQANNYPLGKPRNALVNDDGVEVEIEINPYLKSLDPNYYDAVIGMLENKFLDGMSIEFSKNVSTYDDYDSEGKRHTVIDD